MKLTKSDIEKIVKEYDLGMPIYCKSIKRGMVNFNFNLKTSKGPFIIRTISRKYDEMQKNKLEMEFKIQKFLIKNKFPYQFPYAIKNIHGNELSEIQEKKYWIYKRIEGNSIKVMNVNKEIEIAKALAIYHKTIKSMKIDKKVNVDRSWLFSKYKEIKNLKPDNEINKLMLDNIDIFHKILKKYSKLIFTENILVAHNDFYKHNMIFKGNKIVGIIDFDNLSITPRINDIAIFIKYSCLSQDKFDVDKLNILLNEYEKIWPLTKKEKQMIPYYILLNQCNVFAWYYYGMKRNMHKQYDMIKLTVDSSKHIIKYIEIK